MGSPVQEKKMHYPVMTERQLAFRCEISLKTLRRWRLDGEGPIWHKLFQLVRYHEADILEFERVSAQHWTAILGDGERVPRAVTHPPEDQRRPSVLRYCRARTGSTSVPRRSSRRRGQPGPCQDGPDVWSQRPATPAQGWWCGLLRNYAPSSRRASTDCMSRRPSAIR